MSKRSEAFREALVAQLMSTGALRSETVRDAFLTVPRERFVPEAAAAVGLEAVYSDAPIVTKMSASGAAVSSSSQPAIMATMLDLLDVEPGMHVLEVGTGTGYNAALLRELVGARGRVVSVVDPELARLARERLRLGGHKVRVVTGDGRRGWPEGAPYDRLIVTASVRDLPSTWLDQLAQRGLVVAPCGCRRASLRRWSHRSVGTRRSSSRSLWCVAAS